MFISISEFNQLHSTLIDMLQEDKDKPREDRRVVYVSRGEVRFHNGTWNAVMTGRFKSRNAAAEAYARWSLAKDEYQEEILDAYVDRWDESDADGEFKFLVAMNKDEAPHW